jgi:hypothetical protein
MKTEIAQHTPGPWRVGIDGVSVWQADGPETKIVHTREGTGPERRANARLIAAAPEMLEALYSALNTEGIGPEQAEKIGLDYAWHFTKIRNAIAKAEGRAE